MKTNPSILRSRYALTLLRDRDEEAAAQLLRDFETAAARHPYPAEIVGERELLAAIRAAHKNGEETA